MFVVMSRDSVNDRWESVLDYKESKGAQKALVNLSRGSDKQWDIFCSITRRLYEEETVEVPEIVKERTNKGAK